MSDAMNSEGRVEGLSLGTIEREMRDRESMLWSRIALKLAGGIPLTLVWPVGLAILFSLIGWVNDWGFSRFWLWLLIWGGAYAALAWKLLPPIEGQSVFVDEMMGLVSLQPENDPEALTLEDLPGQEPATAARVLFAPMLRGPRILREAWLLIRARKEFGPERERRAMEIVRELSTYTTGIPWVRLRQEKETVHDLLHLLGFLKLSDWIGVGREGKVWLLSEARKAAMKR